MKSKKFLCIIVCFCTCMLAEGQVKLSFNPTKGETYVYRFNTEQSIRQEVMGQDMSVNTIMTSEIEMNIQEKSANEIIVDYVYKEITMDVSSPMVSIKFDSKKTAENLTGMDKSMALVLNSFVGKTMRVVFMPDGSVKSISGVKEIMAEARKNMPSGDMASEQILNTYTQSFNEESMKGTFEQLFQLYPDKEVKVGDTWDKNHLLQAAEMNVETKSVYTLKSAQNDNVLLDVTSAIVMKPGPSTGMSGEVSGTQRGEINLNAKTGMPINSSSTQNLKGKFSTQGIDITMSMVTKGNITLQR